MIKILHILTLFLVFNKLSFGQEKQYKNVTNEELRLINDLCSTFIDTSISFVISPLIIHPLDTSSLEIEGLKKAGFNCDFLNNASDTLLISNNDYFKIISPDSLLRYENMEYKVEDSFENGIDLFETPLRHYINETYKKDGICYFYKPIFMKDKSHVIIEYWVNCGFLCGWGEIILMKRAKTKWIRVETMIFKES